MTQPLPFTETMDRMSSDAGNTPSRRRHVQLAALRDELLAPVTGIVQLSEMLRGEAAERGPQNLVADLERIYTAGQNLLNLANEVLPSARAADNGPGPDLKTLKKRVRHDMQNALNTVINYSEILLEDAEEQFLEGFVGDLQTIHEHGKHCSTLINQILDIDQNEAEPAAAAEVMPHGMTAALPEVAERDDAPTTEPGKLLVVDDLRANRDLLSRLLQKQGHTVRTAENGFQALQMLLAETFDLVLLDILMPEMNGFQVLQRMKEAPQLRHVPVVVISALGEMDSIVRCIELGAEDYLPKPFDRVLLKARIDAGLQKKRLSDREVLHLRQIEKEQQRSNELLHVILPHDEIVKELKTTDKVAPRRFDKVAVLFADLVGFTNYSDKHPPEAVVEQLQFLVENWEAIALEHQVQKIKTIGDAFMGAAGLLQQVQNPVAACVACGLDMIEVTQKSGSSWNLRVGIHYGPVVAGVIGRRQFQYDLWGDTVNTAARMESHGVPGAISMTADTWREVMHCCTGESRGLIEVKGKGKLEVMRVLGMRGEGEK